MRTALRDATAILSKTTAVCLYFKSEFKMVRKDDNEGNPICIAWTSILNCILKIYSVCINLELELLALIIINYLHIDTIIKYFSTGGSV